MASLPKNKKLAYFHSKIVQNQDFLDFLHQVTHYDLKIPENQTE